MQTLPAVQVVPHAPQFALSVCVFAQYALFPLPHVVRPLPQLVSHVPFEHTLPFPQTVPQAPQFALSVFGFAQNVEPSVAASDEPSLLASDEPLSTPASLTDALHLMSPT